MVDARILAAVDGHSALVECMRGDEGLLESIDAAAQALVRAYQGGHRALFCGNGGSAADAQHLAAELSGRFYLEREPLAAEALHVNTSFLTAVANDYSFADVYARAVRAAGQAGDVLVALSTSGESENVVRAARAARDRGLTVVALTGAAGGRLRELAAIAICVPSTVTPRVQEAHILIGHTICELVESRFFASK